MPKSLADGKTKFTVLTTAPALPGAPTLTELNAGIQAAANILASDFTFGATDSDTVGERSLADKNNVNALSASNYTAGITVFRYFDTTTGVVATSEDTLFTAVKAKGTELWCYARKMGKDAGDAWASTDEIYLGAKVITDEPAPPSDLGGYIKFRVPMQVQAAYPFITAGPAPAAWAATTAYTVGTAVTTGGGTLQCIDAGTSAASAPTLPASVGGTVVDGSVTWQRIA